jgi:CheY-like chemotaxis protein
MAKKILIVEDTIDVQEMMKWLIESYGYEVITANTGQEAIELTQTEKPDLILMDIRMPVLDGIDATRIIRGFHGHELPILGVTAFDNRFDHEALEAGCNEILSKPLDFHNFEKVLLKYLPQERTS